MSHPIQAFVAPRIFNGVESVSQSALLVENGRVVAIVPHDQLPPNAQITRLESGVITPGFVDLQINGGGGVLFNDDPSVEAIRTICATQIGLGTTSVFVTLISDTQEKTKAAIDAAIMATQQGVPGFAGLHLEGPHLDRAKAGAHDARHFRTMTDSDVKQFITAREQLPALLVTLAPEAATPDQVRELVANGVVASLGHSSCSAETARSHFDAGATMATHLFNAMSGISARNPGLAAAALNTPSLSAGLIADSFHVSAETIQLALAANRSPGRVFLVSDAMPVVGTDADSFELSGKTSFRRDGRLVFADGTLAGADLCLAQAARNMHVKFGVDLDEALLMATAYPATAAGISAGQLTPGARADFVWLDDAAQVRGVWLGGIAQPVHNAD